MDDNLTFFGTLFALLILAFCAACGHPERYGCNISPDATSFACLDGTSGALTTEPCHVEDTDAGAVITCPDGSTVEILDGLDGSIIICQKTKHHKICKVK